MKRFTPLIFILSFVWICCGGQVAGDGVPLSGGTKIYRLGVQIDTSREDCLKQWQPLADYLTQKIPGTSFNLVPMKIGVVSYAIESGDVDFVLCNEAFFALFCEKLNTAILATRINNNTGKPYNKYAGVIFCRSDNETIYSIQDLKGKVFAYPSAYSLGGWLAVWREMLKQDFDPKKELNELRTFGTQEEVVTAVLNGSADAGSVRSDVLVMLVRNKIIKPADFRVINKKNDEFDMPHSTSCYPEWGFIQLPHVPDKTAKAVSIALLQMKPDDPAAKAAQIAGWGSVENYQQVIECLKELKIGPYVNESEFSLTTLIFKHWIFSASIVAFILLIAVVHIFVLKINAKHRNLAKKSSHRNDQLTAIFNNAADGLAYCNERDEIVFVNKVFCNLTGFSDAELMGSNVFNKIPSDIYRSAGKLLGEYRRNNYTHPYETTYCINGIDVILRIRPFYFNNKYSGSLFSLTNVKDLTAARKEAASLNRELEDSIRRSNRLAARALHSVKSKNSYLAGLNRDIRTPLNGIIGLVNIIENTELQPQQRNYVNILKNSTETLISLLDKAMDMSRLESEEVELDRVLFDLRDEVAQIEELFRFRAEEKGISLNCSVDEDVPHKICNTPDRLRQVMINLVSNAVRCTDKGKVNLRVMLGETTQNGNEIKFIIADTGIGISPDKLEKIFDDVYTESNSLDIHMGKGIGLMISQKIARLMGGEITAESAPGIGSTFTLTIPDFHTDVTNEKNKKKKPAPVGSAAMLKGLRVLIAEDNQVNRLVLEQILTKHGCAVKCVENGHDAIEEIKTGDFDIVLMDCHMPVLDGFEATLEIRRMNPPLCNLPILAITANAMPQIKNYCFRCGMNGYISKPFSSEMLKAAIVHCLLGLSEPVANNHASQNTSHENIDIDQQALAERIGQSGDVMKRIVKLFLDDCLKSLEELHQCLDDNNMEQAAAVAHSLKGSSALAGATRIQNAAMEAEQAALDCDREYLGKVIDILENCFKKYKSAVSTCI